MGATGTTRTAAQATDLDLTDPGEPPFRGHVDALLHAVATRDLEAINTLCDDTFGIVDIAMDMSSRVVEDPDEHTAWFAELFATLDATGAETWSTVTRLRSQMLGHAAGLSDLRFTQHLRMAGATAEVDVIATVVWKHRDDGRWVEARWHASVLDVRLPDGFPIG